MPEIVTDGLTGWAVRAEWYGESRVIFRGSIFDCIRFVSNLPSEG